MCGEALQREAKESICDRLRAAVQALQCVARSPASGHVAPARAICPHPTAQAVVTTGSHETVMVIRARARAPAGQVQPQTQDPCGPVGEGGPSQEGSLLLVRGVLTGRAGCAAEVAGATCVLKILGGAFGATPPPLASARRRCLSLASLLSRSAHASQCASSPSCGNGWLVTGLQWGHSGR